MSGCNGCLVTGQEAEDSKLSAINKAKALANQNKNNYVVYYEYGEYGILDAATAYRSGYGPIIEALVQFDQQITA